MDSITIKELFRKPDNFRIPSYQRAYAWADRQHMQFIKDLEETKGGYYLGHYLFEEDKTNKVKNIIDGQQRLTTIVIFVSCIINALKQREDIPFEVSVEELDLTYLHNFRGVQRFHTVSYDDSFFRKEVINRNAVTEEEVEHFRNEKSLESSSQRNIRSCRKTFDETFAKQDTETLIRWLTLVEDAKVTYYEVASKVEAAQIFAFQNDRGKSLTNLEVLKSFFMLQIYLRGSEGIADYIQDMESAFQKIYSSIVKIKTDEDQVLRYFWMAYRKGFNTENPLDEIKEYYRSRSINKIIGFMDKLAEAFKYVAMIESSTDRMIVNINRQGNYAWALPVLLKGYVVANVSEVTMGYLAALLENFTIRAMVRGGRANVESRLNALIKDANDDKSFLQNIRSFIETVKTEYWNDKQFEDALRNGYIYNRSKACGYVLWRYEESLHKLDYQCAMYTIKDESLDHIAPQTPKEGDVAHGYGVYNDKDKPENGIESGEWLSSIGNLVLVSKRHNSSMGNKDFSVKLKTYGDTNILMQQKEIHDQFMNDLNPLWDKPRIEARCNKIVEAALTIWDLNKILPEKIMYPEPLF